jgi:glycosyltransferase involved in cell wall biosynthesis
MSSSYNTQPAAASIGGPNVIRRRIAIYVPALIGGGAERVAASLSTALAEAGHQITLIVDFEALHNDKYVSERVERLCLAGGHGRDILRLADILRERRPDIVLAIGAATNIKLVAAHMLARLRGGTSTRIVLSYHGPSFHGSGWLGWAGYPLAALLSRYASMTICVSDDLVRHLVDDWKVKRNQIVRIYNPIAVEHAKPAANEHALAQRPPNILAMGRLVAQKDYPTLLSALALIPRSDVQLIVYGEGPDEVALKALAGRLGLARRVRWAGYVVDPWDAYAAARCFVLSSQNESFGNVIVEALASGLPVVSTACGGPKEILADGQFGALVPVGDAVALSVAITRALDHPGEPARRVARARQFATRKIAERYVALFDEILSS